MKHAWRSLRRLLMVAAGGAAEARRTPDGIGGENRDGSGAALI